MDEAGKYFASVALMATGAFLIVLCVIINALDLLVYEIAGAALCGFGAFIFYLRRISVSSQQRVKKPKVTRVVRDLPPPKPKVEEKPAEKPKEAQIMCDTCQFYNEYTPRQKCKYLTDADRMAMINAGMQCVEYKIKLSLLDEE